MAVTLKLIGTLIKKRKRNITLECIDNELVQKYIDNEISNEELALINEGAEVVLWDNATTYTFLSSAEYLNVKSTNKKTTMFKLTGTVKIIKDTVQITDKFAKREFVVSENSSMYPQDIMFQAAQDKCSMLDGFQENDQVEVSFNLRGRGYEKEGKTVYYSPNLDCWKLEKAQQQQTTTSIFGRSYQRSEKSWDSQERSGHVYQG